jgi:hypothetical protein
MATLGPVSAKKDLSANVERWTWRACQVAHKSGLPLEQGRLELHIAQALAISGKHRCAKRDKTGYGFSFNNTLGMITKPGRMTTTFWIRA